MQILIGKGNGRLPADLHELPEGSIIAALWEILICTLQTQKEDGSWENIREITAYAVLTINALITLPIASHFREQIDWAITRADSIFGHNLITGIPSFCGLKRSLMEHMLYRKHTFWRHCTVPLQPTNCHIFREISAKAQSTCKLRSFESVHFQVNSITKIIELS